MCCCMQAAVSIVVSAAIADSVYSTRAYEAELAVFAHDGTAAGLGRYDRQSREQRSFRVTCLTAGSGAAG